MWLVDVLVLGPIALGVTVVGLVWWTSKSCPACKASKVYWIGAATFENDPRPYRVFRCSKCDLELVADRGGKFHRRDNWVPAPGALPRAFVRRKHD